MKILAALLAALLVIPAMAGDCPCPEKGEPAPKAHTAKQHAPKPPPPDDAFYARTGTKPPVRPLVGGGISWGQQHRVDGWHVFSGVQFPKDRWGHNWQLQGGYSAEKRNDAFCVIGCRDCKVPGGTDERAVFSTVLVF